MIAIAMDGPILSAEAGANGTLTLRTTEPGKGGPVVVVYCEDPALAADLAKAVNGVLARHAPKAAQPIREAA